MNDFETMLQIISKGCLGFKVSKDIDRHYITLDAVDGTVDLVFDENGNFDFADIFK